MTDNPFHVEHVVKVAKIHPFYSTNHEYPPTQAQISQITKTLPTSNDIASQLSQLPLTKKKKL